MIRRHGASARLFLATLSFFLPQIAHAIDCSGLPTSFTGNEFPTGDFFTNFNNPCYTIPLGFGNGAGQYGDLNAKYFQTYYRVDPRYELIVVGSYPNARYFSIALYDEHSALSQTILDTSIVPLTSQYRNPYLPGAVYLSDQQFAVPVSFGGTPGAHQTGCQTSSNRVRVNSLDATQRHAGMDWNSDPGIFQAYPDFAYHIVDTPQHTNPNGGGVLMIRAYLDLTELSSQTNPHIIVRDVASGCAYPAAYAMNTLQVTGNKDSGASWIDKAQTHAHNFYGSNYQPHLCNASPAWPNQLTWFRMPEFVPGTNPDASYLVTVVPAGLPAKLAAAGEVMRIRLRIPTTPPTPCTDGCTRSGEEQMRYVSLSFMEPGGTTVASIADSAFTKDANGYATLIVGTGATIPSSVAPANGYTFLDLTKLPNYQELNLINLRHMIPSASFNCAGQYIPYRTSPALSNGTLMGDYIPVVDYPVAATLPQVTSPMVGPHACDVYPTGQPGSPPNCAVLPVTAPAITSVVTQCASPGCTEFAAQSNPPITINGEGFGQFPDGVPFTGTSEYLQIHDNTGKWQAGHSKDACSVTISSWTDQQIQFVANLKRKGDCPLTPGDQLEVKIWNPQTMEKGSYQLTVSRR